MQTLKRLGLRLLHPAIIQVLISIRYFIQGDYLKLRRRLDETESALRKISLDLVQSGYQEKLPVGEIGAFELKIYSQNGEDGILFYLFSVLGTTNRTFVEFGVGDGRQCNTANLALNFGWTGLLLEIDPGNVAEARRYYQENLGDHAHRVQVQHCHVTRENINQVLESAGLVGEIDLLSIDIDGNDYWVWEAISVISPRVVVVEYNASFGPQSAITIPYNPNFNLAKMHNNGFYHGASLGALTKLANRKGYVLIGCESNGVNAFFVRNDLAQERIPEVSVASAYRHHRYRAQKYSTAQQWSRMKHMDFVEV